ncbi:FAD-binding oxidoreductase [Candidatus Bathyarchaeota archaeon]|nr:FAD-binding oxidoreductase [Candidatus Bathyarchaeota archaeon]
MAGNKMNTEAVSSPAVFADDIYSDAPELGPLLDRHSSLLVYTKSNPHFDDIRTLFNHEITTTPRAIVRPTNENELTSSVSFCAEHKLPMSVRSGGHDLHGRSLIQDGVVIDVRALADVRMAREHTPPHAVVGPGVKSGDLLGILDHHGLVTPVGWCSEVSYAGWAAGGGYGVIAGYYGMGADQILGARVVTPNGAIVDTDEDPELLWALRGAGLGNFGVILELRCRVYPRPRVLAGVLAYPFSEVRSVLGNFERICAEDLPRAFSGEVAVGDSGFGPAILIYFHWILDDNYEEGRGYLRKMGDLGNLVVDTVSESESRSRSAARSYN